MITYLDVDSRWLREVLLLSEKRLSDMVEIDMRGYEACCELYGTGKTIAEKNKELDDQVASIRGFVCETGMTVTQALNKLRELIRVIENHDQQLRDLAVDNGGSPGPNDPTNHMDIRVPFPVYRSW